MPEPRLSIVVLTEQALGADDAARLVGLHAGRDAEAAMPQYRLIVPEDHGRSLLADVLDNLSLLDLRAALDSARGVDDFTREDATGALSTSVAALTALGATAEGQVVDGDPVAALQEVVATHPVDEVVVVTRPHAVEDTFHTDWASQARERLGVPVLHVYAGSSWLG